MADAEEVKKARSQGLKILSRRDQSAGQLAEKLRTKGFSDSAVRGTLDYLQDLNYLDDARFALNWGRSRIASMRIGARRLRQELFQKQLDSAIIEHTLTVLFSEADETTLATECARKKLSALTGLDRQIQRRRLAQHLYGKGFNTDTVYSVLKQMTPGDAGE